MKKYKIEIEKTYCIDVQEDDIFKAKELAEEYLDKAMLAGTEHYNQTGDTNFSVYDVSNTDDPFNPIN